VTQNVTINAVVPGAPAIGAATPGNAQAQIGFTPPSQNGGSAILDYTATCVAPGPIVKTGTGTVSPIPVTALVNGTTYDCSVTARNVAGSGAASATVSVTPQVITVPDAPIIGLATPGDGSASIAFSPPLNNGGAAISQYSATCNPGAISINGAASPISVGGLTNGVLYACSVTATNSAGTGPASATVDVTPEAAIALVAVQSRKTHTGLGPITGAIFVEPRAGSGDHLLAFQFDTTVNSVGGVSMVGVNGMPIGTATHERVGSEVRVTISGIADGTRVKVTLTGVNGSLEASASLGFLVGDVGNSFAVTAADISAVKARQGASVMSNARYDFNLSGVINGGDVSVVKARAGAVLP
jgi:large repetitive protein